MNRAHAPRGTYAQFFFRRRLSFFFGGGGWAEAFFFSGCGMRVNLTLTHCHTFLHGRSIYGQHTRDISHLRL